MGEWLAAKATAAARGYAYFLRRYPVNWEPILPDPSRIQTVFGEDHNLGGEALEIRVKLLLTDLGFEVRSGRPSLEDFVVPPPSGYTPERPLVLEIKSGKAYGPHRDSLRQLDDWVFELSGEEEIRHGRVKYEVYSHMGSAIVSPRARHPTPHKGLLIYNGPLGKAFDKRGWGLLDTNNEAFARARNFCIMSLGCLLEWHARLRSDPAMKPLFWQQIQETAGVLASPS